MKIRITNAIVGHGWSHNVGEVIEVEAVEAGRLIEAGVAEVVKTEEQVETATIDGKPAEVAAVKTTKSKRKAVAQ